MATLHQARLLEAAHTGNTTAARLLVMQMRLLEGLHAHQVPDVVAAGRKGFATGRRHDIAGPLAPPRAVPA